MKTIRIGGRAVKLRVVVLAFGAMIGLAFLVIFSGGGKDEPKVAQMPAVVEENKYGVLVAARPITGGSVIDESYLRWEEVYESKISQLDITSKTNPDGIQAIAKMKAKTDMEVGERIKLSNFEPILGSALATKVRQGYRAYTFAVDGINSVGGYLTPGDTIDIFYRFELPSTEGFIDRRTITIAENVRILAADNLWKPEASSVRFGIRKLITVEVTLEQAGELAALGGTSSGIYVVLRNPLDKRYGDSQVLGETSQIVKTALEPTIKKKDSKKVNIIAGGQVTVMECTTSCVAIDGTGGEIRPDYGLSSIPTASIKHSKNQQAQGDSEADDGAVPPSDDAIQALKQGKM